MEPGALYPADSPWGWYYGVLPTFLATFVIFGYNYTWGVYQRYYLAGPYAGELSVTAMTFVGSLGIGTLYLLGPVVGKLVEKVGVRIPLVASAVFMFLGLFLAAYVTAPWQLYLTQGLLYGIGGSFAFYSTISLSSQWFRKRRGLAGGIAYAGSGIGGIVYSTVSRALLESVGHQWALRVISFISLGGLLLAAFVARERFPVGHGYVKKRSFVELSLLKDRTFAILALMGSLCGFGFLGPFFFTPSYAASVGIEAGAADTLLTILSGVSAVGRVGLGFVADRFGKLNSLFVCTFVGGLLCMVYWPFATTFGSLAGFMALYGLFGGGFIGLLPVVVAVFVRPEKLANATGVIFCFQSIGFYTGTLIAAAILDASRPNVTYVPAMMYCGAITIAASMLVVWLRLHVDRRLFAVA